MTAINKRMASEKGLRKAPHLTAEQKEERRMGAQMGDIEFQMEIAPYFDYKAPIDPSIARHRGVRGLPGDKNLSLGGLYVRPEDPKKPYTAEELKSFKGTVGGKNIEVPMEPGTVSAVHNKSTPNVWAHEYRHQMGEDGGSERYNRLADAAVARTDKDWESAVKMWGDDMGAERGHKVRSVPHSESQADLLETLQTNLAVTPRKVYAQDFERGARGVDTPSWYQRPDAAYVNERLDKAVWSQKAREQEEFNDWNNGLRDRNKFRSSPGMKAINKARTFFTPSRERSRK